VTTSQQMPTPEEASQLTMGVARPLFWTDTRAPWPKRLSGATCFILRLDKVLIGITADHVIRAFEQEERRARSMVAMLRTARLDLTRTLIDRDSDLDLATFRVTEEQAAESQARVVDCRGAWPVPMPCLGSAITFAGFPDDFREECSVTHTEFRAASFATRVEALTDRGIVAIYDPVRGDHRLLAAPEFTDVCANWSGCSGGPVLVHYAREGLHRWHAVGVIVQGPRGDFEGTPNEFDQFVFRRIDFVNADGTLKKSDAGWLPRRGH
jgi:hypothetical protein